MSFIYNIEENYNGKQFEYFNSKHIYIYMIIWE